MGRVRPLGGLWEAGRLGPPRCCADRTPSRDPGRNRSRNLRQCRLAIHTSADPDSVVGSVARFRLGDDRFVARILEPSTARFELTLPPAPCSFPIADTKGLHGRQFAEEGARVSELPRRDDEEGERAAGALIKRLEIQWPKGARRLTVLLLPDCDVGDQECPVSPLDHWLARRPVRLRRFPQPLYRTEGLCDPERSPLAELPALQAGPLGKYSQMRIDHA